MSDPTHLDQVEALNAMRNMAQLLSEFRNSLREEGFNDAEAMKLTASYVQGLAQGASR